MGEKLLDPTYHLRKSLSISMISALYIFVIASYVAKPISKSSSLYKWMLKLIVWPVWWGGGEEGIPRQLDHLYGRSEVWGRADRSAPATGTSTQPATHSVLTGQKVKF